MKETAVPCKNCRQKHPIGEVSGIKKNMNANPPCWNYEPKEVITTKEYPKYSDRKNLKEG